jgi:hypothetical protein
MKKVQPDSLLTSNYPTYTAERRRRSWRWTLFGQRRSVLFVCGHTISEDVAGADAWINKVVLTQEGRNAEGKRQVTLCRPLYYRGLGHVPLRVQDVQGELFARPAATSGEDTLRLTAAPRPPIVGPRKPIVKRTEPGAPKVGLDAARREAEERQKKEAERDERDDAKGA